MNFAHKLGEIVLVLRMAAWRGPVTIDVRIPALPPSLSPPTTHYPVLASKVNRGRAGQGGFFVWCGKIFLWGAGEGGS